MTKLTDPATQPDFSALDNAITKWWKENRIFEKSVDNRGAAADYIFYDGPPFMSGMPHYGHLLGSMVKDVIPRYQTMKGKRVERVWGWDCHGLPIENKVEAELGLKSRRDIEALGLDKFIEKCYEWNRVGIDNWRWYVDKIGRWADMDNAYRTLDQDYMESVWWVFKQMWEQGHVYEGKRTSLFSTDSSTPVSNFEVSMDPDNYRDTEDIAVTVKFKLTSESQAKLSKYNPDNLPINLLAWTTTPWTLPSNFALAVNPTAPYVIINIENELLVLTKSRLEAVMDKREYTQVAEITAEELIGLGYEQLYNFLPGGANDFQVYSSDYVTTEDGTGVLHVAPAFGEADFEMGELWGLSFTSDIDDAGNLVVGPWTGTYLREANPQITTDLEQNGKLFKQEKYSHRLPYYRYKNPLIYKAQSSYFVNVQKLKDKLLDTAEQINWVPSFFKDGRFKHILETAPDWSISRSRYWGTAMPLWKNTDGEVVVVGSRDELVQLVNASDNGLVMRSVTLSLDENSNSTVEDFTQIVLGGSETESAFTASQQVLSQVRNQFLGETVAESQVKPLKDNESRKFYLINGKALDMHRPYIDDVKFIKDGKEYTRITETLDVWMDSGSMPFAQFHYPFVNEEKFKENFPGDFIAEYTGQIRAWFYVLHLISNALFGQPAFRNVLVTGVMAGTDGRKMSKSLGNYPDPKDTLEKYGAEALRLYFMNSPLVNGGDMNFNENDLKMQVREVLIPLWNIYKYFVTYANLHNFEPNSNVSEDATDKWMLALLNKGVSDVDQHFASYEIPAAIREVMNLINETSKWYIRSNRGRFADGDKNALQTLYTAVVTIAKLAAPVIPFTTEHIYRELELAFDKSAPESIHLADYPVFDANMDLQILSEMETVRAICDLGQSIRTNNALKVRQPLATLEVKSEVNLTDWMQDIIKNELNVKQITTNETLTTDAGWFTAEGNNVAIALDSNLTAELKYEGLVREVIRAVQAERKRIGTEIEDRIILALHSTDAEELSFVQSSEQLRTTVKATEVNIQTAPLATPVKGTTFTIQVAKA